MQRILEMFFKGGVHPGELGAAKNSKYKAAAERTLKLHYEFISLLNDEQKNLYEKLIENEIESDYIEDTQSFVNAFSLGANFMLEILCFRENQISEMYN